MNYCKELLIIKIFFNLLLLGSTTIYSGYSSDILNNPLPAFPGAEGFGKYTTGGRGGEVIYVTNLNDDMNKGSFRYAVSQSGSRVILFRVSGTIRLKSNLVINNGDLTIAGQTAPGDGITIRDYPVIVNADNIVIRFLRFRLGDLSGGEHDALGGRNCKNIIVDHCSMSWSTDEVASFYDNENFTLQWSILSEGLRNSVHGKGRHGYGGIWGGVKASFHHNVFAHNDSRNPRFCGSRYSNQPDRELVDFRNNVIYNWGGNSSYGGEGGSYNIVNNVYKAGPATLSNRGRILQPYADDGLNSQPLGTYGKFFIHGNLVTASIVNTSNNWLGVNLHNTFPIGVILNDIRSNDSFYSGEVTTHLAETGYEKVLLYAGAAHVRDAVDIRIIHDVSTGTATITEGGNGSTNGLIDTQDAAGGWPQLYSAGAPLDSDGDGIPDYWENKYGLDANSADDAWLKTVDSEYPNIEVYLNEIVEEMTVKQLEDGVVSALLNEKREAEEPQIYYNRSADILNITHKDRIRVINIYSISGTLLQVVEINNYNTELKFERSGLFFVQVIDEHQQIFNHKILRR